MTKVDFYILPEDSIEQRHVFACRLAEKAHKLGHHIYIHSEDSTQAELMDQLLWSWRNTSFLPHSIESVNTECNQQSPARVRIGVDNIRPTTPYANGLMINLSSGVPDFFSSFDRVAEIVVQQTQVTTNTRANFRFYRDRGYQLDTHDLRR